MLAGRTSKTSAIRRIGKKAINIMIAIINKDKAAILYIFFKIAFLGAIKLYQLMSAQILNERNNCEEYKVPIPHFLIEIFFVPICQLKKELR